MAIAQPRSRKIPGERTEAGHPDQPWPASETRTAPKKNLFRAGKSRSKKTLLNGAESLPPELHLWFPAFPVIAFPKLVRGAILQDPSGLLFDLQRMTGAPGDVPQVAKLGAEMAILDFRVEIVTTIPDAIKKVFDVPFFPARSVVLFQLLPF